MDETCKKKVPRKVKKVVGVERTRQDVIDQQGLLISNLHKKREERLGRKLVFRVIIYQMLQSCSAYARGLKSNKSEKQKSKKKTPKRPRNYVKSSRKISDVNKIDKYESLYLIENLVVKNEKAFSGVSLKDTIKNYEKSWGRRATLKRVETFLDNLFDEEILGKDILKIEMLETEYTLKAVVAKVRYFLRHGVHQKEDIPLYAEVDVQEKRVLRRCVEDLAKYQNLLNNRPPFVEEQLDLFNSKNIVKIVMFLQKYHFHKSIQKYVAKQLVKKGNVAFANEIVPYLKLEGKAQDMLVRSLPEGLLVGYLKEGMVLENKSLSLVKSRTDSVSNRAKVKGTGIVINMFNGVKAPFVIPSGSLLYYAVRK